MKTKQRIVIRADVFWQLLAGDGVIEHPTHRNTVDVRRGYTKTYDAAGEYIHQHHDPEAA